MSNIFISGTAGFGGKSLTSLPISVKNALDEIIYNNDVALIGDCQGVDTLVQQYFASMNYDNVIVYCSGNKCRNIIDTKWQVKNVFVPYGVRGRDFYAVKDTKMAEDADSGIAIWDGQSKGTGTNIQKLVSLGKTVTVYRTDKNCFEWMKPRKE